MALLALGLRWKRDVPQAPAWAAATLAWVLVQGAFGKFTVTLKLAPAVVTLHLLGGLVLLLLLVLQWSRLRPNPAPSVGVSRAAVLAALALLGLQVALGGWVSSNYAVLACQGFPQCNGAWWPDGMDWQHGFTLWRGLGRDASGQWLPALALVAIHMAHRLMAVLVLAALAALAWKLAQGPKPRLGQALAALLALQFLSGLTNVVLGWPLVAALLHTAGGCGPDRACWGIVTCAGGPAAGPCAPCSRRPCADRWHLARLKHAHPTPSAAMSNPTTGGTRRRRWRWRPRAMRQYLRRSPSRAWCS